MPGMTSVTYINELFTTEVSPIITPISQMRELRQKGINNLPK